MPSGSPPSPSLSLSGLSVGGLRLPLPVPSGSSNPGFIDWLYLDEDLRITRGSKGSLFVHIREAEEAAGL